MIKVLFICHGNICRSPMAEYIMKKMVADRGMADRFTIASAATSTEEIWGGIGNPVYPPAKRELEAHGIPCGNRRAIQVTREDYQKFDLLLCMDRNNLRSIRHIIPRDPERKIGLLLDYCGRKGESVADPWYTDRFDIAYRDIEEGCRGLLDHSLNSAGKEL